MINKDILKEVQVEEYLRNYLNQKGWDFKNTPRKNGEHGWDIATKFHKIKRKAIFIECKGDSGSKYNTQKIHNSFWTSIGQVMARMDIQVNDQKRGRIYAIGIPKGWEDIFKKKARKMKYGWNFLKLRIFLVKNNGDVEEKTYKQFLK